MISHREELIENIPQQIRVRKTKEGRQLPSILASEMVRETNWLYTNIKPFFAEDGRMDGALPRCFAQIVGSKFHASEFADVSSLACTHSSAVVLLPAPVEIVRREICPANRQNEITERNETRKK